MWYSAARNRALGGGITRKKPATPAVAQPVEVQRPIPDYMKTLEEKLPRTDGFMQGYTPDILNVTEREPGSFMRDQHEGPWQEYTPEAYA